MWLIIIGVVAGSFLTLNADWKVDGKVFDSSEMLVVNLGFQFWERSGNRKGIRC